MSESPVNRPSSRARRRDGGRVLVLVLVFAAGLATATAFWVLYGLDLSFISWSSGPTATAYLEVMPLDSPQAGNGGRGSIEEFERHMATFIVLAKTNAILRKAVQAKEIRGTRWYAKDPSNASARLAAAIQVTAIPQTNLIVVRMSGAAPIDLPEIVNTVAGILVESAKAEARQDLFDQINEWKKQAIETQNELAVISREIKNRRPPDAPDLKRTLYMVGELLGKLATQREELSLAHSQAKQALEAFMKQEKDGLLDSRSEVLRALSQDPTLQAQIQKEVATAATAEAYRQKYGLGHPDEKETTVRLASLRRQIAERRATVTSLTLKSLKDALVRRVTEIDAQMASVKIRIAEARRGSRESSESLVSVETKETRRRFLEERLNTIEQQRMELTVRRRLAGPIRIVQPAVVPE